MTVRPLRPDAAPRPRRSVAKLAPVPHVAAVLAVALVLAALAGCSERDGFEDRTAVVEAGGTSVRFTLDTCGLDDSTLFVVGRSDAGEILQLVVELADDGVTGEGATAGVSFDVDDLAYAAFGAEAWQLRLGEGPPPGTIERAALRGARIQVGGEAVTVDAQVQRRTGPQASTVRFSLDARCDERADRP